MQAMSKFPRNMHLGRTLMRFLVQISTVYYCLKVKTFSSWILARWKMFLPHVHAFMLA
uniref:Uncharacterized protein n=1 Tax=Oryza glumipatula TaxID=40148 RepID=A0A0E0APR0_9ORYZ